MQYIHALARFIRRHWVLLFLLLALVLIAVALVLRRQADQIQTPPTLTDPGATGNPNTSFNGLVFTGSAPITPQQMWVASVTDFSNEKDQELLASLIAYFRLEASPHVPNVWNGPEYSLTFDPNTNTYQVTRLLTGTQTNGTLLTQPMIPGLISSAESIVTQMLPNSTFESLPSKVELLLADGVFEPAVIGEATHLSVPFSLSFYQLPVFLGLESQFPLTTFVDSTGALTRLDATPFSAEFTAQSQHSTLSIQQALRQVEQGNARIISSYSESTVQPILDAVVRGEFTSATLEYRLDPATNLLIPYYRFAGTLVNSDNDIFSAEVITPAVRLDQ